MQLSAEQQLQLIDSQRRSLGTIAVERREELLIFGKFEPGPAFSAVEPLFRDFEEAVNAQALGVVDELDAAIAALGLHLASADGTQRMAVHDVQIWGDGGFTCRLCGHALPTGNGSHESAQFVPPVRE